MLLLSLAALADCPDPAPLVEDAERDALSLFLQDAQRGLQDASAAFACAPADRLVLARYWLVQGLIWALQEDASADRALAAARRDAPALFPDALGEDLKARWAPLDPAGGTPVPLKVRGARKTDRLRVDGVTVEGREVPPGLHVVQLERDGTILDGRVVDVSGDSVEIAFEGGPPELASGAGALGWTAPWPGPPTWTAFAVRDASGARLSFARDVIPVAMVSPAGPELWRVRRRNARLQRVAAATAVLGGWLTYLYGWELENGENLTRAAATRGWAFGVVALGTGVVWEGVLVARRRANRRGMLEAAASVGSAP